MSVDSYDRAAERLIKKRSRAHALLSTPRCPKREAFFERLGGDSKRRDKMQAERLLKELLWSYNRPGDCYLVRRREYHLAPILARVGNVWAQGDIWQVIDQLFSHLY